MENQITTICNSEYMKEENEKRKTNYCTAFDLYMYIIWIGFCVWRWQFGVNSGLLWVYVYVCVYVIDYVCVVVVVAFPSFNLIVHTWILHTNWTEEICFCFCLIAFVSLIQLWVGNFIGIYRNHHDMRPSNPNSCQTSNLKLATYSDSCEQNIYALTFTITCTIMFVISNTHTHTFTKANEIQV